MSVMIQIRNVPDALHRKLKARAAMAGKPLSQYLLEELRHASETPTREDVLARITARPKVVGGPSVAAILREERDR
jgi:plasmid stability protein